MMTGETNKIIGTNKKCLVVDLKNEKENGNILCYVIDEKECYDFFAEELEGTRIVLTEKTLKENW